MATQTPRQTVMDPYRKEIRIAVMGATGSGKSIFVNLVSDSDLPVGHGLGSCTSEVQASRPFLLDGHIVTLIDTPGFDDTMRSDTDILSSIAAYLSSTYERGAKLTGIIYMHRISDLRMSGTSRRNFRMFRELCGDKTLRNVLIVTNMWGKVEPEVGEAREQELVSSDKFFKPVLKKGARLLRHDGTRASAQAIVRHFINEEAAVLLIQDEIVNQHKELSHTAAGAELTRDFREQIERYKEELRKLREDMETAMHAKDEETRLELQAEVNRGRQEIERIKHECERMEACFIVEKSRLDSRMVQMEAENRQYMQALVEYQERLRSLQEQMEQVECERKRAEVEHAEKARLEREETEARHQEHIRSLQQDMQQSEAERRQAQAEREAQYQERIRSLQQEIQQAKAEMKRVEAEYAEKIRLERERAGARYQEDIHSPQQDKQKPKAENKHAECTTKGKQGETRQAEQTEKPREEDEGARVLKAEPDATHEPAGQASSSAPRSTLKGYIFGVFNAMLQR